MNRILPLVLLALLSGCASIYRPITPNTLEYVTENSNNDVEFWYRYDVLAYRGNKKYVKKEHKHGFNVVAVKITNNTTRTLNFARDLELGVSRGPVFPAENEYTARTLRQGVAIYLLYGLLGSGRVECDNSTGECRTVSYIPWGLALAGGNMIVAGSSNAKLKQEFNDFSLYTKDIKPGETIYGIVSLRDMGFQPLSLKLKKQEEK
jgi:hypothetical protein